MKDLLKGVVYTGIFAVPFITLIVTNNLFFPFITGKNFSFRVIVEIIFAAWLILAIWDPQYRPHWSWIIGGFGALLVVMFFANLFGVHPHTSFWSNFERMEGYVTLVHAFLYFLVAGTMLRSRAAWQWFWYTSLAVAVVIAIHGLSQVGETNRIDGRLGNPIYLAIYMLFHIFILFYYFVQSDNLWRRIGFAVLSVFFAWVMFQTGTRGTSIGLAVGVGAMTLYVAIFAARHPQFRRAAIASLGIFLVIIGGFYLLRDASFIQDNRTFARIANINLQQDLQVRGTIWRLAWEGVQERPILGWGQGNFNFVFNQNYDPFLFDQEQWFDRVHNIFLDWLIAGGILGFIAYFSIYGAAGYHLLRRRRTETASKDTSEPDSFSVLEQAILFGLLVAYLTHNITVFDNIVSYIFFAAVLAMIHSRTSTPIAQLQAYKVPTPAVTQVVTPAVLVVTVAVVYYTNIPSWQTAGDLIRALRADNPASQLAYFERALERRGFGKQEVVEQITQQALRVAGNPNVSQVEQRRFIDLANGALQDLVRFKPDDARIHVFRGSFYRSIGQLEQSRDDFALARELSPKKQSIILQQGATAIALDDLAAARTFFGDALTLDERNDQARVLYVATLFQSGEAEQARAIMAAGKDRVRSTQADTFTTFSDRQAAAVRAALDLDSATDDAEIVQTNTFWELMANDNFVVNAINQAGVQDVLARLFEIRVALDPENPQEWATLAFTYHQAGEIETALAVLAEAATAVPAASTQMECYADNIRAGRDPEAGCS